MKRRAFNLFVLLSILLGIAGCGEKPVPTKTVIVTTQSTPVVVTVVATEQATPIATAIATDHKQTALPSDNTMTERISRLMEFYEDSGQFSGTILVAQDGNIIYEDAFGWANLEWSVPNTIDTKFRIASITKQFTAILVMQQVEKGRLQPVFRTLPTANLRVEWSM
jgi:CubicO group peptidase (beta-lactamase class C family)